MCSMLGISRLLKKPGSPFIHIHPTQLESQIRWLRCLLLCGSPGVRWSNINEAIDNSSMGQVLVMLLLDTVTGKLVDGARKMAIKYWRTWWFGLCSWIFQIFRAAKCSICWKCIGRFAEIAVYLLQFWCGYSRYGRSKRPAKLNGWCMWLGPQVDLTIFKPDLHQNIRAVAILFWLALDVHFASLDPFSPMPHLSYCSTRWKHVLCW